MMLARRRPVWLAILIGGTILMACGSSSSQRAGLQGAPAEGFHEEVPTLEYPEAWRISLAQAIAEARFPVRLPAHPAASSDNTIATYLSPDGLMFIMRFPPPSPPEAPVRQAYIEVFQSPWTRGDPEVSYETDIASDPLTGKNLYKVRGFTALGVEAHSPDVDGRINAAFLRFVVDGVEIQVSGGESLELLIEIAESTLD